MNENLAPFQPMAIPLKHDHFRLRRQAQLEQELAAGLLFQKVDRLTGKAWRLNRLKEIVQGHLFVPEGTIPMLDAAVLRLKTIARLPYPVRLYLRPDASSAAGCIAFLEADCLTIAVAPGLLRGGSSVALIYHLAIASYHGLQHYPQYLALLLMMHAPFDLDDRLKAYEIVRLNRYAADCFALICCGNLDVAVREGFWLLTGIPARENPIALNLDALAEHSLQHTAMNGGNLLDDYFPLNDYEPIRPLVLRRFMESGPYRACRGESGGTPREQFEAEVLDLDRQAYPPMDELPDLHCQFASLVAMLAAHWVMEAGGPVTPRRVAMLLELFGMERPRLDEIATQIGWRRDGGTNTKQLLDSLVGGRDWKNIHSVHIVRMALLMAVEEHDREFPEKVQSAFIDIGQSCRLEPHECGAVCEAVLEESAKEPGQNE